ncbi:MAG: DNA topoisomerase IB [Chloroflexota bacterium]
MATAHSAMQLFEESDSVKIDPVDSARAAGLQHVSDTKPGIRRRRDGETFVYTDRHGVTIEDPATLARIKSLAIPPAWTDVWIAPSPRGHIQATGRDARGRKQYRYHPKWGEIRDETKYHRMEAFAHALPGIRKRVQHDLTLPGLPREKILATVVRLLEGTLIRVGNESYAKENHHYGLTTMRNKHVDIEGSTLLFHFRGKSGVQHRIDIKDRRVANIVKRCRDLAGHHLFEYEDEDGTIHEVGSHDVNDYLHEITGEDFTAKDFRTWAGTLLAAKALQEFETFDSQAQAKKNIVQAIETVAKRLGNTPSVCRKCYVHPEVLNAYMSGTTVHTIREQVEQEMADSLHDLSPEEAAVLALLQRRLAEEEKQQKAS